MNLPTLVIIKIVNQIEISNLVEATSLREQFWIQPLYQNIMGKFDWVTPITFYYIDPGGNPVEGGRFIRVLTK